MKIALYGRLLHTGDTGYVQQLLDCLLKRGIEVLVYDSFYAHLVQHVSIPKKLPTFFSHGDIAGKVDFVFSLGGDGTMLDALTLVRNSNIPIAGINTGRLGFLASIGKEEIVQAVDALEKGTYVLDKRILLRLESNKPLFEGVNFALNEFTIHNKESASMIAVHAYINGDYLNTYWADGLIVSTPTGSTAYSLSCGGPVVFPRSDNFVITPVAPHNLNVRPIVVPADSVISFEVEGRSNQFVCALDSRSAPIDSSFQLAVRKEDFMVSLVRLDTENFLTTLRNKLMWGVDKRN